VSATPPRRGHGPDLDDIDADLRSAPDELLGAGEPDGEADGEAIVGPLADELDLHTFLPRECADVVAEYVRAAQEAGMTTVRIVHGKGTGTLRRIVHGVLDRHPAVRAYRLAGERSGSWGATLVELHAAS
jgi:dsDNA-specific endonuclease/ATPase MutS2